MAAGLEAVLAGLLGRAGKSVTILERGTGPLQWIQPEILWPRTVETLSELLPKKRLAEAMISLHGISFFDGEGFSPVVKAEHFESASVQPWSTNPNRTRELLLGLSDFELRRGVEVVDLITDQGRVRGARARRIKDGREFEIEAEWTIGDDGGRSFVRQRCGINLNSRLFPIEFYTFPFRWPRSFATDRVHVTLNRDRLHGGIAAVAGVPLPHGAGFGIVGVWGREFTDASTAWANWMQQYPGTAELTGNLRFPEDFKHLQRYWGHAPSYGVNGAVIIGDAAHPPSPAGGQGANMSIADARTLARLLIGNHPNLVTEYENLRRPANARSLRPTRIANFLLGLPRGSRAMLPTRTVGGFVTRSSSAICRILQLLSTSFQSRDDGVVPTGL